MEVKLVKYVDINGEEKEKKLGVEKRRLDLDSTMAKT
jgi:hypothetical protein